jgi:hypothetical protein
MSFIAASTSTITVVAENCKTPMKPGESDKVRALFRIKRVPEQKLYDRMDNMCCIWPSDIFEKRGKVNNFPKIKKKSKKSIDGSSEGS